jgi:hypothetical protein
VLLDRGVDEAKELVELFRGVRGEDEGVGNLSLAEQLGHVLGLGGKRSGGPVGDDDRVHAVVDGREDVLVDGGDPVGVVRVLLEVSHVGASATLIDRILDEALGDSADGDGARVLFESHDWEWSAMLWKIDGMECPRLRHVSMISS